MREQRVMHQDTHGEMRRSVLIGKEIINQDIYFNVDNSNKINILI